jgi:hypothetical protein
LKAGTVSPTGSPDSSFSAAKTAPATATKQTTATPENFFIDVFSFLEETGVKPVDQSAEYPQPEFISSDKMSDRHFGFKPKRRKLFIPRVPDLYHFFTCHSGVADCSGSLTPPSVCALDQAAS